MNSFAQNAGQIQLANEYYLMGELEKAIDIYSELAKDSKNVPLIHSNYFNLLINAEEYKEAEKYIRNIIKQFKDNLYYKIDYGILMLAQGNDSEANKQFATIIEEIKEDQYRLRITAQYLVQKQLREWALTAYLDGRKANDNPWAYSLELANIYRLINKKDKMVEEYLNYVNQNPANISYVKNILQNLLAEPADLVSLENILIQKVQKFPNENIYSDLLIWVNLQQKNFFGAFIQARAVDKKSKAEGTGVLEIGMIALKNSAYEDAIEIFNYVIKNHPKSINYSIARRLVIQAREGMVKNTFPIDELEIRKLITEYENLISELGVNSNTVEAMRNKALLHAFYLDEKDSAINILNRIIDMPRVNVGIKAKSKLDLGDIYILTGESWESTLLYSQVEKTNKEQPIGYEAKLKNAKLSYYNGDFELAKAHLDVLKEATTREISNDAIDLSLLIHDNTFLDSTDAIMKQYSYVELLLFQNKKNEALDSLDQMLKSYPDHSLVDEIYFLSAKINRQIGSFETAIQYLGKIDESYAEDILGDDALFMMALIYENDLKMKDKAREIYQNFLTKYPGSVFIAEARKHFRTLRGDTI
ncbi:MAG: tetratricopeptide repeat protein [Bacteroidetes bacterium]|nr:tetratricopeptide repeat protein [Bacteroidota bacterium]MDA1119004.1 tetratricopeptide repeat protein [Bacteroidota bacterium]